MEWCPSKMCTCSKEMIKCDKRGLSEIPYPSSYYAPDLQYYPPTMIISNQRFDRGYLQTSNFTILQYLSSLSIRSSNIVYIHSFTFRFLTKLSHLDLSDNVDLNIAQDAFAFLNLLQLKLDNIGNLTLHQASFNNLNLKILSIKQSQLLTLSPQLFVPLKKSLQRIYLKNNLLTTLDVKLKDIFQQLHFIDLSGNRFMCNCEILWLGKILKHQYENSIHSQSAQPNSYPQCVSPPEFRKEYLHNFVDKNHRCFPPKITKININLESLTRATISCFTDQLVREPFDNVHNQIEIGWVNSQSYVNDYMKLINPLNIDFNHYNQQANFICKAGNLNGFSTLDLKLDWHHLNSSLNGKINSNDNTESNSIENKLNNRKSNTSYFHQEVFSILEMIFAVVGTLIITIALFSIFCCLINNHCRRTTSSNGNISSHTTNRLFKFNKVNKLFKLNKNIRRTASNGNFNDDNKPYLSYDKGIYSETGIYCEHETDKIPPNNNLNNFPNHNTLNINNHNTLDNFFPPPPLNIIQHSTLHHPHLQYQQPIYHYN